MRMRPSVFVVAVAGVLSGLVVWSQTGPAPSSDEAQGKVWWAHVQYLADPSMNGRLTGSQEYLKAAAYVVDQFKSYGLAPAGVDGTYYQPVHFDVQRVIAEKSSMSLVVDGKATPLVLGDDAILGSRGAMIGKVDAPLVFIGYGLHLPESKYDDFNSAEVPWASLKGKVVVFINGGPADLPGALKSYARTAPLAKALRDAGAVGSISIPTPKSMDFGWQRVASGASQPGMRLSVAPDADAVAARHPALADQQGAMFSATFNPAQAEKLFTGTGHTFAEMLALADAQKPLPRFALGKSVTATVVGETSHVVSPNIVGELKGSDPKLAGEYVLVSAHLDHLGVGAPINGKTIYSGAMDDASGVATVLETAKEFGHAKTRPKRSMLFVIFTAEEKGLLGSRYYRRASYGAGECDCCRFESGYVYADLSAEEAACAGTGAVNARRGRGEGGRGSPYCDCTRSGAGQEFVYPNGSVQLCAGGGAGAGDEVRVDDGFAGVQGLAGVAGAAVSLDR